MPALDPESIAFLLVPVDVEAEIDAIEAGVEVMWLRATDGGRRGWGRRVNHRELVELRTHRPVPGRPEYLGGPVEPW